MTATSLVGSDAPDEAMRPAARPWTGQPLIRREDGRLLTGAGRFTDDLNPTGVLHAAFARSDVAHGRIIAVDTTEAMALPGVRAVFTAEDLYGIAAPMVTAAPLGDVPPGQYPLASGVVRFVGEPVAIVVADSRALAEDGADRVYVDIEALPSVMSMDAAADPQSPWLHEEVPGNVLVQLDLDPVGDLESAFSTADHVVELTIGCARQAPFPLEGRVILADVTIGGGTIHVTSQAPHYLQTGISRSFGFPEHALRIISGDVGGGFGAKLPLYQEYLAVVAASLLVRRPVKWTADRREELLTTAQAREQENHILAAVRADGVVTGLRIRVRCDSGAYSVWPQTGLLEAFDASETYPGPYGVTAQQSSITALLTNKAPTGPYRGISRVHATLGMERLMDEVGVICGLDPLTVRERNVVQSFPHRTAGGLLLESGSFGRSIAMTRTLVDLDAFRERQRSARRSGRYLGFGCALAIEPATPGRGIKELGSDVMNHYESAVIRIEPDASVTVIVGTHSHGQGHETTFAQVAADVLSTDPASVRVTCGDTATMPYGGGTWASRSAVLGSGAILAAAQRVLMKAQVVAGHLLECDPGVVRWEGGVWSSPDGRSIGWIDLARCVNHGAHVLPDSIEPGLEAQARFVGPDSGTVSNRLHAVIVDVDIRTGLVSIERYIAIEDCGSMINPMVVAGQVRGGVAQGIGQALHEVLRFDVNGQPLSTTMLDYLIPTIDSIPDIEVYHLESPSPSTPGGFKGMGEGGVIPPPAAIANAVTDALRPFGARFDRTPITHDMIIAATRGAWPVGASHESPRHSPEF